MLLKGMGIISIVMAAVSCIWFVPGKIYLIPLVLIGTFVALVLLWCLFCSICAAFIDMDKDYDTHSPFYRYFVNNIIESLEIFMNIKTHYSGKECLPDEKFMLVCNHRSAMDPLLTMGVLREYNTGFIAKKAIYKVPVIRRLMHRCFCPRLDKDDMKSQAKTILRASKLIKTQEASIGIYPEGTRNKTGEGLLPFMSGSFKIAKKADCPIVVAIIKNAENISKNTPWKKTHVYIEFIGVIDKETVAAHNTTELSDMAKGMIEERMTA